MKLFNLLLAGCFYFASTSAQACKITPTAAEAKALEAVKEHIRNTFPPHANITSLTITDEPRPQVQAQIEMGDHCERKTYKVQFHPDCSITVEEKN